MVFRRTEPEARLQTQYQIWYISSPTSDTRCLVDMERFFATSYEGSGSQQRMLLKPDFIKVAAGFAFCMQTFRVLTACISLVKTSECGSLCHERLNSEAHSRFSQVLHFKPSAQLALETFDHGCVRSVSYQHRVQLLRPHLSWVPKALSFLETVECLQQFAHKIRTRLVFESCRYLHVYEFIEIAVQKGSHSIHLVEFEVPHGDGGEHDTDRREPNEGGIRFATVHPIHLTAALGDYANLRARVRESEKYMHGRTYMSVVRSTFVQTLFRVIEECYFSMAGAHKSTSSGDFRLQVRSRYISKEKGCI